MKNTIHVIGAGAVGISCAIHLLKDGHDVVLLDREGPAAGASFGNAGAIVNGSCIPTATPGIVFSALKMLLNKGPLSIKAKHAPSLLPWLIKFANQSREKHYLYSADKLVALSNLANASWHRLLTDTPCQDLMVQKGWLRLFETKTAFDANLAARELMEQLQVPFTLLNQGEIRELEPNIAPIFTHGFFQEDCHSISNPARMLKSLTEYFLSQGGTFKQCNIEDIRHQGSQLSLHTNEGILNVNKIVLCTGAWSTKLTKGLNYTAPLVSERGYHMMLPPTAAISRPVVNADRGFVICPMELGLRVTSQVELADVDAPADYRKIQSFLPDVQQMLPSVEPDIQSCWMGPRPSFPDSLPVISKFSERIYFAFGHQHLGLTLGPITGELIADLVADRDTAIDIAPYRHDRF
jgi:D-amino-acid dehydrogenase